MHVNQS